jgi:hypothetical protein
MKKLVLLAGFFLAAGQITAQEEKVKVEISEKGIRVINSETGDSTFVELEEDEEGEKKLKTGISERANWSSFDFGVGMIFTPDGQRNFSDQPYLDFDPARSWTFNLNIFEHYFGIAGKNKDNFGIVTGLGFNFSHFGYNRNYTINYNADSINGFVDNSRNYSRNSIRAAYLHAPLLLQFNIKGKENGDNFHLGLGMVGGVRIGSRLRQKYIENSQEFNIKDKRGQYFFNPFKAEATVRLGYGDFGAFASYNLVPLFDTQVINPVHNLSFGLMLCF